MSLISLKNSLCKSAHMSDASNSKHFINSSIVKPNFDGGNPNKNLSSVIFLFDINKVNSYS
jgi:hypothetical protein